MRTLITFTCVALCAMLCLPAGLAGWGSYGGAEPDTKYDRTGAYMFPTAPNVGTDPSKTRVYFNGFVTEGDAPGPQPAINDANLGSRMLGVVGAYHAILGVWVDCNHDGYVGMADGALIEYRAEASAAAGHPVDTGICPVTPDDVAHAGTIHNNGGWITELIPIAPDDANGTNAAAAASLNNYRILFDTGVRMWADRQAPPQTPTSPYVPNDHCSQSSLIPVFDSDKASHTAGMMQQIVCDESRQGPTPNDIYNALVASDPTGLIAQKVPLPSTLYQDNGPLDVKQPGTEQACQGDPSAPPEHCESNSNAIVYNEVDCSKPRMTDHREVDDPTGGDIGNTYVNNTVYAPGTPKVNPSGTAPATVNQTLSYNEVTGDCTTTHGGNWIYAYPVSSGGAPLDVPTGNKEVPDMVFGWDGPSPRGTCSGETPWQHVNSGPDPIPNDPTLPATSCGEPNNKGLQQNTVLRDDQWFDQANYITMHPNVGTPTADRSTTPATVQPNTFPAYWLTYYAVVTPSSAVTLPSTATGAYGAEYCPLGFGPGAPNTYGWNCNPADWNVNAVTGLQDATVAKASDPYNLRDVDCYDMTIVAGSSAVNPTHQDIGPGSVAALEDASQGCS